MTLPKYRSWRFLYPGIEALEAGAGLAISHTGGIEMVEGDASIRQAILLLLSTVPGERVMRPEYGCDLHKLVFSPNDDTTAGLAIHYVRTALARWEPRIDVLNLDADRDDREPERLNIMLEYRVRATHSSDRVVFPVSLTGD